MSNQDTFESKKRCQPDGKLTHKQNRQTRVYGPFNLSYALYTRKNLALDFKIGESVCVYVWSLKIKFAN